MGLKAWSRWAGNSVTKQSACEGKGNGIRTTGTLTSQRHRNLSVLIIKHSIASMRYPVCIAERVFLRRCAVPEVTELCMSQ